MGLDLKKARAGWNKRRAPDRCFGRFTREMGLHKHKISHSDRGLGRFFFCHFEKHTSHQYQYLYSVLPFLTPAVHAFFKIFL